MSPLTYVPNGISAPLTSNVTHPVNAGLVGGRSVIDRCAYLGRPPGEIRWCSLPRPAMVLGRITEKWRASAQYRRTSHRVGMFRRLAISSASVVCHCFDIASIAPHYTSTAQTLRTGAARNRRSSPPHRRERSRPVWKRNGRSTPARWLSQPSASTRSRQARSQRRHTSAHTRQCSCFAACLSHSSALVLQAVAQVWSTALVKLAS